MEMYIGITVEKIIAKVKIAPAKHENLHAFGELHFFESNQVEPFLKIKGWTVRTKVFGDQKVLTVVPPAYPAGGKFLTSFYLTNKSLWQDVVKLFLDEYAQVSGALSAEESEEISDSDLDKIAEAIDKQNEKPKDDQW